MGFLIILFSLPLLANSYLPKKIIKECYESDTCSSINGEKIRLAYFDTPKLKGKKQIR